MIAGADECWLIRLGRVVSFRRNDEWQSCRRTASCKGDGKSDGYATWDGRRLCQNRPITVTVVLVDDVVNNLG